MSVEATDLASLSLEDQSPISIVISTLKKVVVPESLYSIPGNINFIQTPLKNYVVGLNEYRKVIYVKAEVDSHCLDNGSDYEEPVRTVATRNGAPTDYIRQLIGKLIGGHGNLLNVFPINSIILPGWDKDEKAVYEHVKKENCSALLIYGMKYDDEENLRRPSDFYYQFKFFENGKPIGEAIERHLKNIC